MQCLPPLLLLSTLREHEPPAQPGTHACERTGLQILALGQLPCDSALPLLVLDLRLGAQDVATPVDAGCIIVHSLEGLGQLSKLTLVLQGTNHRQGAEREK